MHPDNYIIINGRRVLKFHSGPRRQGLGAVVSNGGDVGVMLILKCASRAMLRASKLRLRIGESILPREVHVFVRDPIERLRSVYQFFRQCPPIIGRQEQGTMTYQEFIDYVLGGKENNHWRPVNELIKNVNQTVIVHLFENVGAEYPLGELPVRNVSQWLDDIDATYREPELRSLYDGDYALREEAVANAIRI